MQRIVSAIGVLTLATAALKTASFLRIYLLPSRLSRFAHADAHGEPAWALVTGASDGIGRAFADELSARGFNVVLHGRNVEKLSGVMAQLQGKYPTRSYRILLADANAVSCLNCERDGHGHAVAALDFSTLKAAVDDLHLTILINNAGGSPGDPKYLPLAESSEARVTSDVSLNALFPMHLIRTLLPNLVANGPSLVLNISSMADQGFPLVASYSSSKQFLMNMTTAVRLEMAMEGNKNQVEVLGVKVGRVTGVAHCKIDPSFFTPDALTMARAALDRAGHDHGIVIGYWTHALQGLLTNMIPTWAMDRIIMNVMKNERLNYRRSL